MTYIDWKYLSQFIIILVLVSGNCTFKKLLYEIKARLNGARGCVVYAPWS